MVSGAGRPCCWGTSRTDISFYGLYFKFFTAVHIIDVYALFPGVSVSRELQCAGMNLVMKLPCAS
jgi:hypothetical protein